MTYFSFDIIILKTARPRSLTYLRFGGELLETVLEVFYDASTPLDRSFHLFSSFVAKSTVDLCHHE